VTDETRLDFYYNVTDPIDQVKVKIFTLTNHK